MEDKPHITAWPIKTLPPRSGSFFLAIILGPVALAIFGITLFHPKAFLTLGFWVWIVILSGFWSLGATIHQCCISFHTIPEGIVRRTLFKHDVMRWEDIQAIGHQVLRSKGDRDALLTYLFAKHQVFRVLISPVRAGEFASLLKQNAPRAIEIDENRGTFILPQQGDNNEIHELVTRHARRLRRQHGFLIALLSAIPVLAIINWISHIHAGIAQSADWKLFLICLSLFLILSWGSLSALWRLRK